MRRVAPVSTSIGGGLGLDRSVFDAEFLVKPVGKFMQKRIGIRDPDNLDMCAQRCFVRTQWPDVQVMDSANP